MNAEENHLQRRQHDLVDRTQSRPAEQTKQSPHFHSHKRHSKELPSEARESTRALVDWEQWHWRCLTCKEVCVLISSTCVLDSRFGIRPSNWWMRKQGIDKWFQGTTLYSRTCWEPIRPLVHVVDQYRCNLLLVWLSVDKCNHSDDRRAKWETLRQNEASSTWEVKTFSVYSVHSIPFNQKKSWTEWIMNWSQSCIELHLGFIARTWRRRSNKLNEKTVYHWWSLQGRFSKIWLVVASFRSLL